MSKLKIYKASAGSGKTYTLAVEYIKELLLNSSADHHRHILAVTFTKDATGEMKDRILAELYGLAFNSSGSEKFLFSLQEKLKKQDVELDEQEIRKRAGILLNRILHDYSRLNITTIDSFFQRVLRNLARELGTGSRFNLEMNVGKVLTEAVHAVIEKAKPNTALLEWLTTYIENKLDEGSNWNIEQEILGFSYCIYNEYFQEHEAALRKQLEANPQVFAQLQKKQKEIQKDCADSFIRLHNTYLLTLNTHALDIKDISYGGDVVNFLNKTMRDPDHTEPGKRLVEKMEDSSKWASKSSKRNNEIVSLAERDLMPLLQETVENLKIYKTSRMITRNLHQLGLIWYITREISDRNKENNRFMLSDTALFLNQMMDGSDTPFIYEKLGSEIRHVMIDEFQDTSRLQWSNFKVLLSDILAKDDFSLLVGDVKQSIYRWRNGDWRILSGIEDELAADSESLLFNYRSEKEVVDFNNIFFAQAAACIDSLYLNMKGDTADSPFSSNYNEEAVRQYSTKKEVRGFVSLDFLPKENGEGMVYDELMKEAVLSKLLLLHAQGLPAGDICILTRKNSHIVELGDYLSQQRAVYPELAAGHYLDIVSNEAFQLRSSLAIKIITEALKLISEPDNSIALTQLMFYLSLIEGHHPVKEQIESLSRKRKELERLPLFELIAFLYQDLELDRIPGQSSYLFTFYDALSSWLNEGKSGIQDFLTFWNEDLCDRAISTGEGVEGIRAMSIHKSKGLQFHTVIIPYCDWKLSPSIPPTVWCRPKEGFYDLELLPVSYGKAMDNTIFSEEYKEETIQTWMDNLNVLYVAFTRAEHNLIVLGKDNEKGGDPVTVSDLLLLTADRLGGEWDAERRQFVRGRLSTKEELAVQAEEDNLFKQSPQPFPVSFTSNQFQEGKTIFRQSNQSYEFLYPDRPSRSQYVAYGNVMHRLFESIHTADDIEKTVDHHLSEGIIHPEKREEYIAKIKAAIAHPQAADWFSGKYRHYIESTILVEKGGEVKQQRPDRVLLSDTSTQVVDFKFGEPHDSHKKQVKQYMELLQSMGYPGVQGFLWYVELGQIESV